MVNNQKKKHLSKFSEKRIEVSLENVVFFFTIISMCFSAGLYIGKTNANMQNNDKLLKLHHQILDLREAHDREIEKYSKGIHGLRIEIYSLKEQLLIKK